MIPWYAFFRCYHKYTLLFDKKIYCPFTPSVGFQINWLLNFIRIKTRNILNLLQIYFASWLRTQHKYFVCEPRLGSRHRILLLSWSFQTRFRFPTPSINKTIQPEPKNLRRRAGDRHVVGDHLRPGRLHASLDTLLRRRRRTGRRKLRFQRVLRRRRQVPNSSHLSLTPFENLTLT